MYELRCSYNVSSTFVRLYCCLILYSTLCNVQYKSEYTICNCEGFSQVYHTVGAYKGRFSLTKVWTEVIDIPMQPAKMGDLGLQLLNIYV